VNGYKNINSHSTPAIQTTLKKIEPHVCESLQNRIYAILCWDEIIKEKRAILVIRMTNTAHLMTEVAILLQDDDVIQIVRNLLQSLDIEMPEGKKGGDLPDDINQLVQLMNDGIVELLESKKEVQLMDQQRKELKSTQREISKKMNSLGTKPSTSNQPSQTSTDPSSPSTKKSTGMVFRTKKKPE